jgi:hypothetical protein
MKKEIGKGFLSLGMAVLVFFLFGTEASFGGIRLAVVPFQLEQAHEKEIVRCRSCGNILEGGSIEGDPTSLLTRMLWEHFQEKEKGFDLISPGQIEGVYNTYLAKEFDKNLPHLMRAIGSQMNADYMLWGSVFHYQERKGTSYGVQQPASVTLDLHLLKVKDGQLVWRAQWARTQKSLTENLLEAGSFFKGKMRWVTVEELSRQGLEEMLKDFPSADSIH